MPPDEIIDVVDDAATAVSDLPPAVLSVAAEPTDFSPIIDAINQLQSVEGILLLICCGLLGAICALAFWGGMKFD